MNPVFERARENLVAYCQRKGKTPPKVGIGWLSRVANNGERPNDDKYCMRTYDKDGEALICGNPMWKNEGINAYFCDACCKEKGIFETKADLPEEGKAFVNDIVKNNRSIR